MKHFLQDDSWRQFQESIGRQTISKSGDGWSYNAFIEHGKFGRRLYAPYGPYAANETALKNALASLESEGAAAKVHMVRIEPIMVATPELLGDLGYKHINYLHLQPEQTQIIDLSLSEDEILADMKQNNRNLWRNHAKKGLLVETSTNPEDIKLFLDLIHNVASRNHYSTHSDQYFTSQVKALFPTGNAKLFKVKYEDKVIATAIAYQNEDTMYYAHAAADDKYRKLSPGTILVAEMIMNAKRNGLKYFDLYGIAPDEAGKNHPWTGFTKFKKSFGGQPVYFVGAWEKPIRRLPYYIYKSYQKLRKKR